MAAYDIDTAAGSSGSPNIRQRGDCTYDSTATHGYGGSDYNYGVLWWRKIWRKVFLKAHDFASGQSAR